MHRVNPVIAVSATLFLVGCIPAAKTDQAAVVAQLKANEAKWNQVYADHDAAALASAYAPDAALANPGAALVSGAEAIRRETAAFASDPNLKVAFASDRIQVARSGDLAYTRGHYTLTMTDPETKQPVNSAGNYLTVWQEQSDGSWKAVEDFVTPGPAPAAK
ncbi:MAG TPA: nuclear transport factor 2 family protein [Sphingomicrobium sp.]